MAGDLEIWRAFSKQTGVTQVSSLNEWADALVTFSLLPEPSGNGVFIAGGGGGNSVTYSDMCVKEGLSVPKPSDESMERLYQLVPAVGSIAGNPLDLFPVYQDGAFLNEILILAYTDPLIDMVIVDRLIPRIIYHLPDLPESTPELIKSIATAENYKPTVATLDSDGGDLELAEEGTRLRRELCLGGIPAFPSIRRAARALMHLYRYYDWRKKA